VPGQPQPQPGVDQAGQVDPLRQHRRREQPGVRHQIGLVEAHRHPAQIMVCSHSSSYRAGVQERAGHIPVVGLLWVALDTAPAFAGDLGQDPAQREVRDTPLTQTPTG